MDLFSLRFVLVPVAVILLVLAGACVWAVRDPWGFFHSTLGRALRVLYRVEVRGEENIPVSGGALLVANHQSLLDAVLVGLLTRRPIRFLIARDMMAKWWSWPIARLAGAVPIHPTDPPRLVIGALRGMRAVMEQGGLAMIFAEGEITRTSQLLPFQRGLKTLLRGLSTPVVPIAIEGAGETAFGPRGCYLVTPREGVRRSIRIVAGAPLTGASEPWMVRQAVGVAMVDAFALRKKEMRALHREAIGALRRRPWSRLYSDHSTPQGLANAKLLAGVIALGRQLRPRWEQHEKVGILLPPALGAVVVNLAATTAGRVVVNLNYTASRAILEQICEQGGIRLVLTSRAFVERARLELPAGVETIFLEDVRLQIGALQRLWALVGALALPVERIEKALGRPRTAKSEDLCTLIYSSGSTGVPKGVMLSHWNLWSNAMAALLAAGFKPESRLLGILPFFHSFGYTVALWLPLMSGVRVAYYPNPLDVRTLGPFVHQQGVTHLVATPSFLSIYSRRVHPSLFAGLEVVITGAEKLRESVAAAFERRFGIWPIEGYGATECSPLVSLNVPDYRARGHYQPGSRTGTVGQPATGIAVRVVDAEGGADLPPGQAGMLLVRGPNLMQGYYRAPEKSAEVLRDDWYVTGDIAAVDEDGFIRITDRLSRFSKIAGEMVPHIRIEEALQEFVGIAEPVFAVAGVADAAKGERLVVLYAVAEAKARAAAAHLAEVGLPPLWIPKWSDYVRIEAIPLLGTGKLDLQQVKKLAQSRATG